ncbi:MAG: 2-dehydropantoate 2-reductase [Deltaproteobacteria bacterium]|nr:2-dehydropantoate 2-reductase [Deltaproteobacteria bacterium]
MDPSALKLGVAGAGSIGCYVGGELAARAGVDVVFLGRPRLAAELADHGLRLRALGEERGGVPPGGARVVVEPAALADRDLVLCCVKSAQTAEMARALTPHLRPGAVVVSLQNGVRNAVLLREHLDGRRVVGGIVDFNVISRGAGVFERTTDGPITLERPSSPAELALAQGLARAGLESRHVDDIGPHQWTKLLVNLNNAVSALSGAPTAELLLSRGYRRIIAAVVAEGLAVVRAKGVKPPALRGVPVGLMPAVLRLPTLLARLVLGRQIKVGADSRSSMWEDLTRGRPTEVDYLNGEIVRAAQAIPGVEAPLNAALVARVHEAERAGSGPPNLSAAALARAIGL